MNADYIKKLEETNKALESEVIRLTTINESNNNLLKEISEYKDAVIHLTRNIKELQEWNESQAKQIIQTQSRLGQNVYE